MSNSSILVLLVFAVCFLMLVGESKFDKIACSGFLAPYFVNNDYVTAESVCSTMHACHEVLASSWAALCYMHM